MATSPHQLLPWAPANLTKLLFPLSINPPPDLSRTSPAWGTVDSLLLFRLGIRVPILEVFLIHGSFLFQWCHFPPFIPPFRALPVPAANVLELLFSSPTVPCNDHGFIYPSIHHLVFTVSTSRAINLVYPHIINVCVYDMCVCVCLCVCVYIFPKGSVRTVEELWLILLAESEREMPKHYGHLFNHPSETFRVESWNLHESHPVCKGIQEQYKGVVPPPPPVLARSSQSFKSLETYEYTRHISSTGVPLESH